MGTEKFKFGGGELRVAAHGLGPFLPVALADHHHALDVEAVGAQLVGDDAGHELVHPVNDGHDGDEGGCGQDDAEQSEGGAQFAGPQRTRGYGDGFQERGGVLHLFG